MIRIFVVSVWCSMTLASYSPMEFKDGSDTLLKKAMQFRRSMPKLNRALVRM